jgi:RHS repeat-associated protein
VLESYSYDALGAVTIRNGSGGIIQMTAFNNRFMFTGREYIQQFGIYEYRARTYHPGLGRFMSEDPKGFDAGDYNLFRYCHNDPEDLTDPSGMVFVWPVGYSPMEGDVSRAASYAANHREPQVAVTGQNGGTGLFHREGPQTHFGTPSVRGDQESQDAPVRGRITGSKGTATNKQYTVQVYRRNGDPETENLKVHETFGDSKRMGNANFSIAPKQSNTSVNEPPLPALNGKIPDHVAAGRLISGKEPATVPDTGGKIIRLSVGDTHIE